MADNNDSFLHAAAAKAREFQSEFDRTEVRIGFIGQSGAGKSSLMNAIVGAKVCAVGQVEQTMEPQEIRHEGLVLVDLPGCGTARWPTATYVSKLGLLKGYDAFIIVTHERVLESDLHLYKVLFGENSKPVFVVRNKIDRAIEDGQSDNGHSEQHVLHAAEASLRAQLDPAPRKLFLVSSRHPTKWDLAELQRALVESQTGVKQMKAQLAVHAWTRAALAEKRIVCMSVASKYAALSAVNGLNPIPGLDIAADVGILLTMSKIVVSAYGLTNEEIAYARSLGLAGSQSLIVEISRFLTTEGVTFVLRKWAPKLATRAFTKWLPFIGQAVAMALGYKLTISYAEDLVDDCERAALSFIDRSAA